MRVASFASLSGKELTNEVVEHLLKDILQEEARHAVTIEQIQRRVAEHFDVRLADMTSKRRPANIAFPRQVAMYLARELTKASLNEIGDAFGGRDHGTVLHACKLVKTTHGGTGQYSPDDFVYRQLAAALTRIRASRDCGCRIKSQALHLSSSVDMKFSVTKEKFLEGLQQVQNVVSTRTTLPILSNVLLQAKGNEVHLTTTDLDVGVRGSFEAKVEKEGATTLPARRLFTIIRELPSSEIQIDVDGKNAASIRSGQSFFKILGLPEEEFPPLPKFENAKVVTIRQKDLRDGLRKTSYAISTDETRYVLNGVLFSFKENKLTLVATDGRRLAMVDIELEFPRSHEADIIVPTKAVTELQRLLTDDGEVKVSVGSGQIAFDLNNTLLVSKLIEGNYPNYQTGHSVARRRSASRSSAKHF